MLAAVAAAAVIGRSSIADSIGRLRDLHPGHLALGVVALLATLAASAGAWRCALRSAGAPLRYREAWGCYGLGSLANTVLPARLGEAVRIGSFAGRLERPDRRWLSGGACVAVAGMRAAVYALTCAGAGAAGLLPGWTLAAPLVAAAVLAACVALLRTRARGRTAGLGLVLGLSPAAGTTLLVWVACAASARLAGAALVLGALDVAKPFAAALVGLGAFAVANTLPLAPGGAGLAGAGMALALERSGVAPATAVAAAVAFHAAETLAGLLFGSSGSIALRSASAPVCRPEYGQSHDEAVQRAQEEPEGAEAPRPLRRGGDDPLPARLRAAAPEVRPQLAMPPGGA